MDIDIHIDEYLDIIEQLINLGIELEAIEAWQQVSRLGLLVGRLQKGISPQAFDAA